MAQQVRRSPEQWAEIVSAWERSGLSPAAFAASRPGLSERTLRAQIAKLPKENPGREVRVLRDEVARLRAALAVCTCQSASSATVPCQPATGPPTSPPGNDDLLEALRAKVAAANNEETERGVAEDLPVGRSGEPVAVIAGGQILQRKFTFDWED